MRVVLYARVSTPGQAEQNLSIPDQLRQLTAYCQDNQHEVIEQFSDHGASATDDNRPAFQEMVAYALDRSNEIEAILVLVSSRFYRDSYGARFYKRKLRQAGVRVISITQATSDDPTGQFVEGIFELQDEYESHINGYHTLRGMKENARQGNFNGSRPPYGYRIETVDTSVERPKRRLVSDEAEAEIVRRIFGLYVDGLDGRRLGIKALTEYLNSSGVPYRGGRQWSKQGVQERLADSTYIGEYYFNRTDSKTRQLKPESEWILVPVEPIVDEDLFKRAAQIRKRDRPSKMRPPTLSASTSLLTGLLHCGKCGARMVVEVAKSGKYRYYVCSARHSRGKSACGGTRVPMDELDRQVLEHLGDRLFSVDRIREIIRELSAELARLRHTNSEKQATLQRQLLEVRQRIKRQYDAIEVGAVDVTLVGERLRELKDLERDLAEQLEKASGPKQLPPYLYKEDVVQSIQSSLRTVFLSPDRRIAKRYLNFVLQRIDVEGNEVRLDAHVANVLAIGATNQKGRTVNHSETVLPIVLDWLPDVDSNHEHTG